MHDTLRVPPVTRPPRIAVVGPSAAGDDLLAAAEECGSLLARAGAVVITGGRGGVMAAASRGAARAGGLTIGLLPGHDAGEANDWVAVPVATGLGEARNALVVAAAQGVLAVGLSWGTLSEVSLAMATGKPVVAIGVDASTLPLHGVQHAQSPEDAVRALLRALHTA